MNVLIVDDDVFSIKGLEKGISWEKCGISRVFSATSAKTAKELLGIQEIDILICDIEMPYARSALKMNVFDYILKPSPYEEIEKVLFKAAKEKLKLLEEKKNKKHQTKKENALREKYYKAILDGTIPYHEIETRRMERLLGINMPYNLRILLILHDIKFWNVILEKWSKIDIEFSLKNIAREVFSMNGVTGILVLPIYDKYYLSILECEGAMPDNNLIRRGCRQLDRTFISLTGYGINSAVGEPCRIEEDIYQIIITTVPSNDSNIFSYQYLFNRPEVNCSCVLNSD